MASFHIYILKCNDNSYYIGHTDNLEQRISAHHIGLGGSYTAGKRPVKLEYAEEFASRAEALEAERKLKKWTRAKKEALIKGGWQSLQSWKFRND